MEGDEEEEENSLEEETKGEKSEKMKGKIEIAKKERFN